MQPGAIVWRPDPDRLAATRLSAFLRAWQVDDYAALLVRAHADPSWFWDALIRFFAIRFQTPYRQVLDISAGREWPRWCVAGETNLTLNCVDRHRGTPVWDKAAILWQGEDGSERCLSYAELDREVCRLAGGLRAIGIGRGDVVALYLPMLPETAAAFFAVAKIGAIAMPLFSGFGPDPLRDRINAAGACAVITVDATWRRGTCIAMKRVLDEALVHASTVRSVIVLDRCGTPVPMQTGRDHWWHELAANVATNAPTDAMPADAPVMLMYTSGTTGAAKGTIHTHCGMLVKNALDVGLCLDVGENDRLMWLSDLGWVAGTKVIVSATLLGATLVMAEGTPDYPHAARQWQLVERYRVTHCGTVPTAIRQVMRYGDASVAGLDLSSLRAVVTAGEPWNAEAWLWCFEHICKQHAPILNYGGGTECGGAILIGTFHHPLKACSFGGPVPGMGADIVDAGGITVAANQIGELVLRRASIGLTRGLWHDDSRYIETYWRRIPNMWVQGDLAMRDSDGLWYLLGRSDDTLKLAGKRTGPAEIEAVLMGSSLVAEAAAIGLPDALAGSVLVCVCVPHRAAPADVAEQLTDIVARHFGRAYRPRQVLLVADLPKTRNQKVMRRVMRAVLSNQHPGDLAALMNPESIEMLAAAAAAIAAK